MDDEVEFKRKDRSENGQFLKGFSGNPRGRPRTKHQRAVSSRQYRRDVLGVTEEIVPTRTAEGGKMMPFHTANLLAMRAKASQGHAPSQRYLDKLHREAIQGHENANPQLTRLLESCEDNAVNKSADGLERWEWRNLNLMRKFSWRF